MTTAKEQTTELSLPSRIESIDEAAAAAAEMINRAGAGEEAAFGVDLAVREAVANAVLHGNRQDAAKTVDVAIVASAAGLVVTVRDRGDGFDPAAVPDPTDAEHIMNASGRGILFMRTFMNEVTWEHHPEGGTVVRMAKKF